MKRLWLAIPLLAAMTAAASPQKTNVVAPPPIRIDASQHDGLVVLRPVANLGGIADVLQVAYTWQVRRDGTPLPASAVEKFPDNTKLAFAAGPPGTSYEITLAPVILRGTRKADDSYSNVQVTTPGPITAVLVVPGPPAPPVPTTSPPPGRFGVAQAMSDILAAADTLTPADRKRLAAALAVGYGNAAALIESLPEAVPFRQALALAAGQAGKQAATLGLPKAATDPVARQIGLKIESLINATPPLVANTGDWTVALHEMVVGLKAASQ